MLAAGIGLNVNRAAARNFESSAEIADLKNDIAKTRLEMQLAQLRRDAEFAEGTTRRTRDPGQPT